MCSRLAIGRKTRWHGRNADLIVVNLLFIEEHLNAILPALTARRDACDAMVCLISDGQIVKLTKMGDRDMSKLASGAMALLKSLRPSKTKSSSGQSQMKTLRRLPKILRLIPGKAQDLRAWLLSSCGCATRSKPTFCCISACMARWRSCPANQPACRGPAGPTG